MSKQTYVGLLKLFFAPGFWYVACSSRAQTAKLALHYCGADLMRLEPA